MSPLSLRFVGASNNNDLWVMMRQGTLDDDNDKDNDDDDNTKHP